MNINNKMLLSFLLLTISAVAVCAQNNSVSSSGIASGSGGNSSYTVGQVFYQSLSSVSGHISLGVQQAFEVKTLNNNNVSTILLDVKIIPNPTKYNLVLKIYTISLDDISYQLYDLLGRQLANQQVKNEETSIQMDDLPAAVYVLKIIKNNSTLKSFKIIKNQ